MENIQRILFVKFRQVEDIYILMLVHMKIASTPVQMHLYKNISILLLLQMFWQMHAVLSWRIWFCFAVRSQILNFDSVPPSLPISLELCPEIWKSIKLIGYLYKLNKIIRQADEWTIFHLHHNVFQSVEHCHERGCFQIKKNLHWSFQVCSSKI